MSRPSRSHNRRAGAQSEIPRVSQAIRVGDVASVAPCWPRHIDVGLTRACWSPSRQLPAVGSGLQGPTIRHPNGTLPQTPRLRHSTSPVTSKTAGLCLAHPGSSWSAWDAEVVPLEVAQLPLVVPLDSAPGTLRSVWQQLQDRVDVLYRCMYSVL